MVHRRGKKYRLRALIPACAALLLCAAAHPQDKGWRQALPGYGLEFPRDHASHPDYKIEWWYYTGNLEAGDGRRFGYQLTFFRVGVDVAPDNPSRWAVRDLYMAHLAVSDISGGKFRFSDRVNRAGVGWAGADSGTYRVWNEDWQVWLDEGGVHHLKAEEKDLGIDLELRTDSPPVLHGEGGYSRKGASPGNATYYYSFTRISTSGRIFLDGSAVSVKGFSWMDHEFGTSFLEADQIGWDWFSIRLDDGTDLMLFQLRRDDGSRDRHSSGTIVSRHGKYRRILYDDFDMQPLRLWHSETSGADYPAEWSVHVLSEDLNLNVRAAIDDQELRATGSAGVIYWEGAVSVTGTRHGSPVEGRGYLEMTGYAGGSIGSLIR